MRVVLRVCTVKWFNNDKGFGFIAPDGGAKDVSAHHSDIQGDDFRSPEENQRVQFEINQGPKRPLAVGSDRHLAISTDPGEPAKASFWSWRNLPRKATPGALSNGRVSPVGRQARSAKLGTTNP